jgi:hypothetical protein
MDGATVFMLDVTKTPIESEVLPVDSIPFKVAIHAPGPRRSPVVVRTYPTWNEKILTGVIEISIFNPTTRVSEMVRLQLDYNMSGSGQCVSPPPLKFPSNPPLSKFIANGKVGISLLFRPGRTRCRSRSAKPGP